MLRPDNPQPGRRRAPLPTALFLLFVAPPALLGSVYELYDPGFAIIGGPSVAGYRIWGLADRPLGNGPILSDDPVALAVGELVSESKDLVAGGLPNLAFSRYYGSFVGPAAASQGFYTPVESPMGANWIHNYFYLLLKVSDTLVVVYYHRGSVIAFEKIAGVWTAIQPPTGLFYKGIPYQLIEPLAAAEAGRSAPFMLEMMDPKNDLILRFDVTGMASSEVRGASSVRDRNGNTHTLTYSTDGTLVRVADDLGRRLDFEYVTSGGRRRISRVTEPSGRSVSYGYSGSQLISYTNPRGKTTTYTYVPSNLLQTVTLPLGNVVVTNAYDTAQRVMSQLDGEGNETTFAYTAGETLMTNALGGPRTFRFDGELRLTELVDEAGQTVRYGYDDSHRIISVTDRLGDTSTVTHHAPSGKLASRADAEGRTWTYSHTPKLQDGFTFYDLTRIDYPDGTFATLNYDAKGNVTSISDRAGDVWTYAHNGRGQVLEATNPAGGVTSYTYNPDATVATLEDPAGNVTTYGYDTARRLHRIDHADGSFGAASWDAAGNLLSITEENGQTTTFTWDDNDNLATVTDALGNSRTFAYDHNDDLVSVTDPHAAATTLSRDALRRTRTVTDRNGATIEYRYDSRGRLIETVDAEGQTWTYVYDEEGVRTSQRDPAGRTWSYDTDRQGRITSISDPLGQVTTVVYNELGGITELRNALGDSATFELDDGGRLVASALPEGIRAQYLRGPLGNVTLVTDPRGHARSRSFDSSGRIETSIAAGGETSLYGHDTRNRATHLDLPLGSLDLGYVDPGLLTELAYSDGTTLDLEYDDLNRLVAGTGLAFSYDDAGRLTGSNGIEVGRDAGGRVTSLTFESGKTVTYTYDGRGLLTSVSDWTGSGVLLDHDEAGRPTELTRSNGVVTTYVYDAAGELLSLSETGTSVSTSIQLDRDAAGRIVQATRDVPLAPNLEGGVEQLAYDVDDQVVGFGYDAMGRLTDDGEHTLSWDLASRLSTRTEEGSTVTVTYTHDALGQRLGRRGAGATQNYVWNYALGLPSISVVADDGVPSRYFIHTPAGALLYSIDGNDEPSFHHFDETGSTLFLTDGGGNITDTYAYDPYGRPAGRSGTSDNPFTWGGRFSVLDDGAGLYYLRSRIYDSSTARFVSRHPLWERPGDAQSLNQYGFANQNPISFVDPSGVQATTGHVFGRVCDEQGVALPGVTVTFSSPSLRGARLTTSDSSGSYRMTQLAPGEYEMTAELEGFATCVKTVTVGGTGGTEVDFKAQIAEVVEEIVVTSSFDTISETSAASATPTYAELEALPIQRQPVDTAGLAPGLTATVRGSEPPILGGISYKNLFLINGVEINENVRGEVLPLFTEDAISETTTSVGGLSAEYGRFTGGGVSSITTRSGMNEIRGGYSLDIEELFFRAAPSTREAPVKVGLSSRRAR